MAKANKRRRNGRKKKKRRKETKTFFFFWGNLLIFRSFLAGFSCRFGFHFSEQRARRDASAALGEGETAAGKPSGEGGGGGKGDPALLRDRSETAPRPLRSVRASSARPARPRPRRLSLALFHQHRSPVTWSQPGREAGNTHTTHTPFLQYFGCLPHGKP